MLTSRLQRRLSPAFLIAALLAPVQAQEPVQHTVVCEAGEGEEQTWSIQREGEGEREVLHLLLDGVQASHGGFVISAPSGTPASGEDCLGPASAPRLRLPLRPVVGGQLRASVPLRELEGALGGSLEEVRPRVQAWYRGPAPGASTPTTALAHSGTVLIGGPVTPPNVLMIVMDDIGFEFLRCYHDENRYDGDNPFNQLEDPAGKNLYPHTPFLDELAERSLRFTQFHVNASCSSTRAMLYTGRYSFRTGIGAVTAANRVGTLAEFGVGPGNDEFTLPQVMSSGGYQTGFVGKWHLAIGTDEVGLGGAPGTGFPHVLTYGGWDLAWSLHGNLHLWPYLPPAHIPGVSGSLNPADDVPQGYYNFMSMANFGHDPMLTPVINLGFVTDFTMRRSWQMVAEFERTQPDVPWFQTQCYNAAHSPWGDLPPLDQLVTAEYWPAVTPYGLTIPGGSGVPTAWSGFCAHVESLDTRLAEYFKALGGLDAVLEDTMVFLLSENGSPSHTMLSAELEHGKDLGSSYPLMSSWEDNHFKNSPYDRGTRVPMLIAGPMVANPGGTCRAPLSGVDILPTLADIAGTDVLATINDGRPLDGASFLPLIVGAHDDQTHIDQVRDSCLVERFSPNGDPRLITPPLGPFIERRSGFLGRSDRGWFKLVRTLQEDGTDRDELYWLYDSPVPSPAGAVDPFELHDLYGNATFLPEYLKLRAELEALLATEP